MSQYSRWPADGGGGGGGSGTVTSVGLSAPSSVLMVSGSPVTTSGTLTLTLTAQSGNTVWASPANGSSGAPTFRSLVLADLPAGAGTVTSVAMSVPAFLSVSGSPITSSGTLAVSLSGTALPIANGGTASTASLSNNRVMKSAGGAIVEAAAITASRALASDANGIPVASTTTSNELDFVHGVTSSIQAQLNGKQDAGNYITDLTGDVSATGPGSASSTIQNNVVTNAKLAQMATHTIKGNNTGGASDPLDLTAAQVNAILPVFTSLLNGLVPLSGGGTSTFLRADGTWASPSGSGTVTSVDMSVPAFLSVSGNPITSSGTLAVTYSGTALPVANGGTNSTASLNNNRVMQSSGGAIVEAAAITASRALASDSNGIPVASATTATELGYVSGVTSAIQTQLNGKQASGNYITALTGDVAASGPGSAAATIQNNVVSNAKLAQMATLTIKGNNTGGASDPLDLTVAQVNAILPVFTSLLNGLVPFSGGGTTDFLRADGTWAAPTGGSGVTTVGAIDTQTPSSDGLVIASTSIYAQSASSSNPGMVNNTAQTMSGNKTFSGQTAISNASTTALTVHTNALVVDATNNIVGIGVAPDSTVSLLDIVNTTGSARAVQTTGYGGSVGYRGRYANGTSGSPTAATAGNNLNFIAGRGYGTSQFAAASTGTVAVVAGETFSNTSNATYITLSTTPTGSVTLAERMRINSTGNVLIGTTTDNATDKLQVNGSLSLATALTIANGGTGQTTKSAAFNALSPNAVKGDITVYSSTNAALGVGSNNQVLTADSSQTLGVKWGSPNPPSFFWGDGSDGSVVINSGTTLLTRDMFYNDLTINGTGAINTAGYRIFVLGTLDLTAAPANCIRRNGGTGNSASGATGGALISASGAASIGGGGGASAGATGTTGAGANGSSGSSLSPANGGQGGVGGGGGAGSGGAGGSTGGSPGAVTLQLTIRRFATELQRGIALIIGGSGGTGGASGGGDGTVTGGGGGGGGAGGCVVYVAAKTISRGGSTAASAISSTGGNGGLAGGNRGTNCGGGAGGGGGGGGWIYVAYENLVGSTATNMIDATPGTGGNGGAGTGTGIGGDGGASGGGGRITTLNVLTNVGSELLGGASVNGTAGSGVTAGTGGTPTSVKVSI